MSADLWRSGMRTRILRLYGTVMTVTIRTVKPLECKVYGTVYGTVMCPKSRQNTAVPPYTGSVRLLPADII